MQRLKLWEREKLFLGCVIRGGLGKTLLRDYALRWCERLIVDRFVIRKISLIEYNVHLRIISSRLAPPKKERPRISIGRHANR